MSVIRPDLCEQTQAYADILRANDLIKTTEFVSKDAEDISQMTGIPLNDVVAMRKVILARYGALPVSGTDLYTSVLTSTSILSTGLQRVDALLDGGLYTGEVTEVVGGVSSGKTQLCLGTCVATVLEKGQEALYIDTGGTFSARRLAQILEARGHRSKVRDVLRRIQHCRAYSIEDVFAVLADVKAGVLTAGGDLYAGLKLVVLDSVAAVVYPFLSGCSFAESQGLLSLLGNHLRSLAVECSVAVLVTNNVVQGQDGSKMASLGRAWSHVPHVRFMIEESGETSSQGKRTLTILKSSRAIRCLLNIWGVMLFLRLSWVTGQAGIGLATVVILLSTVVTVITSLSMSAICTNGIVKGGGAYYMISRSLGPEYGGAIGIIFSVANAVAVAMYVVGFAETVRDLLKAHDALMVDETNDIRIVGCITITLLLAIAIIGMEWEARAQVVLMAVLLIAIANFMIGTFIPPTETKLSQGFTGYRGDVFKDNFLPDFRDGEGFFSVFSIFFPAATGILAGANISGDLKNPQVDIPKGTILAIAISGASYIAVVWVLGTTLVRDATGTFSSILVQTIASTVPVPGLSSSSPATTNITPVTVPLASLPEYSFNNIQNCSLAAEGTCKYGLMNDYQAMEMVSGFGPLITAGIFSATLSSALASLVSAPKVFQAVCKDKIFPKVKFFAKGYGASDNPRRAYFLAYFIGVGFILIGDLNAIAPIISNFFLMAYTLINYSCFDNSLAKAPGWRPSFKYYSMWLSLAGALLCITVMFIINWWTALITFAVIAAIFVYVHYRKPDVNWGSSTQAHVYRGALQGALKLVQTEDHIKNFRPQVLVLTGFPCNRPDLVYFVNGLTKKISLMVCGHIIEGNHSETLKEYRRYKRGYVNKWLTKRHIKAFYSVTTAQDFRQGAQSLMQNAGIGKLKPNILIMGFKSTWKTDAPHTLDSYFSVMHDAFDYEYGVGILRLPERLSTNEDELVDDNEQPNDDENNYDVPMKTFTSYGSSKSGNSSSGNSSELYPRQSFMSVEDDSPPATPSRRDSTPEIETPPKDIEQQSPLDQSKSFDRSLSKLESNLYFAKKHKGTIDVWWLFDDGGLTLLVPYILQTKQQWKNCGLRVFTAGTKRGELVREQKQMAQLLSKFRIECQDITIITDIGKLPSAESKQEFNELIKDFVLNEDAGETQEQFPWKTSEDEMLLLKEKTNRQMRLRELLKEHSMDASLIVMTLPVPRKGTCTSSLYLAWLETLTRGMPPILLLRGNQTSVLTFYS